MNSRIGVIDIGSNSVHLVVAEYFDDNGHFNIIEDAKVNVRLCEGLSETGLLNDFRMDLGVQTMAMFKAMCDAYKVAELSAVATAAVRKADNGHVFVERVKDEVGIAIKVIPGETEATMDYLGTINSIDINDGLLMDIGGGSVEFVLINNRQIVDAISLPFGSIDLTEKFALADKVTGKKLDALNAFLEGAIMQYPLFKKAKGLPVLGVGGTIRNIGRIHRQQIDYPMEIAHNYVMTDKEVKVICELAADMNLEERKELKGLSKGRTDIFVGASHAVLKVMGAIKSKALIISNAGLRDGVIYDFFGRNADNLIENVFESSLRHVVRKFNVHEPHAMHVYKLASMMYDQLKPIHKRNGTLDRIRLTSAMLHDVGVNINYSNHHEHSFYLILNSGVCGLTQKELLMSAFVALNHRTNKKIKIDAAYKSLLDSEDKEAIDLLSLFLQIAEYLDRGMDGAVQSLNCKIDDDEVTLQVKSTSPSVFESMVISECGKKFMRVIGRNLKIENEVIK